MDAFGMDMKTANISNFQKREPNGGQIRLLIIKL